METADRTMRYLFILALVLILVAYYVGANSLGGTLFSGINTLGLTFTGRNSSGQFAGYPK
jgi:ABC-type proline/glycine betaine transport system permease subunit